MDGRRDGGTLTVAPGKRLSFSSRTGLVVEDGGRLDAVGSCAEPILFTGEGATRGVWRSVQLRESAGPSTLSHVIVEDGGSHSHAHASAAANLAVGAKRFSMTNSTIRESGDYGVVFEHAAAVDAFTDNHVTANAHAGFGTPLSAGVLDTSSSYTGNDEDAWIVDDDALDDDVTWAAIDVPYRVIDDTDIDVAGHLTIAPGVTVEFGHRSSLIVEDGALTVVGIDPDTEASRPITFTGAQKTRGYWRGIQFYNSNREENRLRNAVVEYGGGDPQFSHASGRGNVVVSGGSRLVIVGSTVHGSAGYGIFAGSKASVTIAGNDFSRNADGPQL
ncbi:right-handed parallel beta-helix repeat-containing protein [Salinigranum marinum]|uniref:right-handed parallel beta-helix repeat-containing protein n=1 Tax=Salinigranum marinum TaxID=1515595 RepID=UPI002989FA8C|nr:right-handed parallel beta-helix repeat-containing protein [Salinigranum marinum]